MPITIVLPLLAVAVCATAALCLMVGHAIGYRKAEKVGRVRYDKLRALYKMHISSTYGKSANTVLDVNRLYPEGHPLTGETFTHVNMDF